MSVHEDRDVRAQWEPELEYNVQREPELEYNGSLN
jgi:hypothetical protein